MEGNDNIFFFNDTTTTEVYTLSLHDALPISRSRRRAIVPPWICAPEAMAARARPRARLSGWTAPPRSSIQDRKSTRLNSSHANISYAVFCLKKNQAPPVFLLLFELTPLHSPL